MRVVFASTPEQREKISELVNHIYFKIFPLCFTDKEISKFKKDYVLHFPQGLFDKLDTLKDAYVVIASLQTISLIIEYDCLNSQYIEIFYKNVSILNQYGFYFPFEYHHFIKLSTLNKLSVYTKADNHLLV